MQLLQVLVHLCDTSHPQVIVYFAGGGIIPPKYYRHDFVCENDVSSLCCDLLLASLAAISADIICIQLVMSVSLVMAVGDGVGYAHCKDRVLVEFIQKPFWPEGTTVVINSLHPRPPTQVGMVFCFPFKFFVFLCYSGNSTLVFITLISATFR